MANTQNKEIELERTYLARELPVEISGVTPSRLLDIYIPQGLDIHSRLRLRKKDDLLLITKKILLNEGDASAQTEYSIPLDVKEFEVLAQVSQKRIEKDRYKVPIASHVAEVDLFLGTLSGLVLIDFEFETEQDKLDFVAPSCCLAEVTQEDFIAGGNLAGRSLVDITLELNRFNYTAIYS